MIAFDQGIDLTPAHEDLAKRISDMVDVSCFTVFSYVASGLFERHKLVYAAQLCFKIQAGRGEIDPLAFEFLLRWAMAYSCNHPLWRIPTAAVT